MTMQTAPVKDRTLVALWFGILGPPIIWAARIASSYILVPYACWWELVPVMHAVTLVALLLAALAGWIAWRHWRAAGPGVEADPGRTGRTRFMALLGVFSAALFFLVMVAEGLANVFVDPCQFGGGPIG